MAELLPGPSPSDDFEEFPAPQVGQQQSTKVQRQSSYVEDPQPPPVMPSSKLGGSGGCAFDKLAIAARSEGDAVLSYRDGQSIVEVTVRSMDAKQYTLSVAAGSTVLFLKQQLQLQCDVPAERQRLLHKGRDMDNQAKLSAYSTGPEIVLFMVVKFPSPSTWQSTSVAPDGSAPCVVLRGTITIPVPESDVHRVVSSILGSRTSDLNELVDTVSPLLSRSLFTHPSDATANRRDARSRTFRVRQRGAGAAAADVDTHPAASSTANDSGEFFSSPASPSGLASPEATPLVAATFPGPSSADHPSSTQLALPSTLAVTTSPPPSALLPAPTLSPSDPSLSPSLSSALQLSSPPAAFAPSSFNPDFSLVSRSWAGGFRQASACANLLLEHGWGMGASQLRRSESEVGAAGTGALNAALQNSRVGGASADAAIGAASSSSGAGASSSPVRVRRVRRCSGASASTFVEDEDDNDEPSLAGKRKHSETEAPLQEPLSQSIVTPSSSLSSSHVHHHDMNLPLFSSISSDTELPSIILPLQDNSMHNCPSLLSSSSSSSAAASSSSAAAAAAAAAAIPPSMATTTTTMAATVSSYSTQRSSSHATLPLHELAAPSSSTPSASSSFARASAPAAAVYCSEPVPIPLTQYSAASTVPSSLSAAAAAVAASADAPVKKGCSCSVM